MISQLGSFRPITAIVKYGPIIIDRKLFLNLLFLFQTTSMRGIMNKAINARDQLYTVICNGDPLLRSFNQSMIYHRDLDQAAGRFRL